jgi:hypothetical protein
MNKTSFILKNSVPDPYVFGPPGSGFVSQRYGSDSGFGFRSRSGSFHHQIKIRKTLISSLLRLLYDFLSLKNDVNVPLISKIFVDVLKITDEQSRIRKNVTDQEHCVRIYRHLYYQIMQNAKLTIFSGRNKHPGQIVNEKISVIMQFTINLKGIQK